MKKFLVKPFPEGFDKRRHRKTFTVFLFSELFPDSVHRRRAAMPGGARCPNAIDRTSIRSIKYDDEIQLSLLRYLEITR